MTRARAAWIGFGVVALLTVVFFLCFEFVEENVDRPYGPQARRNPLLAAERLAVRLGVPARSVVRLEEVPPVGEVVVFADDRRLRTRSEARRVVEWIGLGGRAIVVAPFAAVDGEAVDPLLNALGFEVVEPDDTRFGYLRLVLPGDATPLFLRYFGRVRLLPVDEAELFEAEVLQPRRAEGASDAQAAKVEELLDRLRREREGEDDDDPAEYPAGPSPAADDDVGEFATIARVTVGKGSAVVLSDADFLANAEIGALDHARAAWRLLTLDGPPSGIVFVHGASEPRFFSRVAGAVWPGLLASAILLGALAWREGRRFGPAEPEAPLVRRRLMEHVEATGRFHWRRGDAELLLGGARRAIAARLQRRRPHLADQPLERRVAALAELSGHSPAEVEHALTPGSPGGSDAFTRVVRTLEAIRRHL
ncbi:MAG TPA: DUF4350 domain-containing protein [Candidatus Polarisedimenticolaceae bacterium]